MIARLTLRVHTLMLAGQRSGEPDSDIAADVAKRMTLLVISLPFVAALIAILFPLRPLFSEQVAGAGLVAVALIGVFGVGWYADSLFDRNASAVVEKAREIRNDSGRGRSWALGRAFGIWLALWLVTGLVAVAVRWTLLKAGVVEGPLFGG